MGAGVPDLHHRRLARASRRQDGAVGGGDSVPDGNRDWIKLDPCHGRDLLVRGSSGTFDLLMCCVWWKLERIEEYMDGVVVPQGWQAWNAAGDV